MLIFIWCCRYNSKRFVRHLWLDGHFQIYSPVETKLIDQHFGGTCKYSLQYADQWLGFLKREIKQPDLWGNLSNYHFELDYNIENDAFSFEQYQKIHTGIQEIRQYLLTNYGTNEEYSNLINTKMDYLKETTKKQGKQAWLYTLVGVIATISAALTLSPDRATALWSIAKSAILGIVKLIGY